MPEDVRDQCWWLVRRDGTPVRGDGGAGVELLAELTATRPLGLGLRAVGASRLVDALDDVLAGRRAGLGKFVPEGPAPRRYP